MSDEEKQGIDSISFKMSSTEKKKITDEAVKLDIPISEYVRIKALMDENDVIIVKEENRKLKKELNELKVKNSFYKKTDRSSEGITLKVSDEDTELLNNILNFDKYLKISAESIEGKIIILIMDAVSKINEEGKNIFDENDEECFVSKIEEAGLNFDFKKIFRNYKNEVLSLKNS